MNLPASASAARRSQRKPRGDAAAKRPAAEDGSVRALILTGYGLNCDYETEYALRIGGATPQRVHVNDLISGRARLDDFQIMAFIGGFAWADDHGAGVVLATKLRHHLGWELLQFVADGRLVIGICNGFQALVNLGLLPGFDAGQFRREVALTYNDSGNFRNQWVHLQAADSPCVFTRGIERIDLPVRHAEGKFVASPEVLQRLSAGRQIVLRYAQPNGSPAEGAFPFNPNGSLDDIAGICDPTGRVFGLMPHPEAYCHFTNHPGWTRQVRLAAPGERDSLVRAEGAGVALFRNAVAAAAGGAQGSS
jgi:phosphoribosylformylglycinamidine synthase